MVKKPHGEILRFTDARWRSPAWELIREWMLRIQRFWKNALVKNESNTKNEKRNNLGKQGSSYMVIFKSPSVEVIKPYI